MPKPRHRPKHIEAMLNHITGYWVSQMVFVAARLGIADVPAKGSKTSAAIAEQVGAHAPSLHRVLRTLASIGVFAETPNGRFRLTPLAATLRSGVPGSLRDFALMVQDDYNWAAFRAARRPIGRVSKGGRVPRHLAFRLSRGFQLATTARRRSPRADPAPS